MTDITAGHGHTRVDPLLAARTRQLMVTLSVSTIEMDALIDAAKRSNRNISDFVRDTALASLDAAS